MLRRGLGAHLQPLAYFAQVSHHLGITFRQQQQWRVRRWGKKNGSSLREGEKRKPRQGTKRENTQHASRRLDPMGYIHKGAGYAREETQTVAHSRWHGLATSRAGERREGTRSHARVPKSEQST